MASPIDHDLPKTPEEARNSSGLFTLKQAGAITGKKRTQFQRWIEANVIDVWWDDTTAPPRYLITGAQLAAIMERPRRPDFVRPMDLAAARKKWGKKASQPLEGDAP